MKSKTAKFTLKDKEYTLEFTRASIIYGEQVYGMQITKVAEELLTQREKMWVTAFRVNHAELSYQDCVELYNLFESEYGNMNAMFDFLADSIMGFLNPTLPKGKKELEVIYS